MDIKEYFKNNPLSLPVTHINYPKSHILVSSPTFKDIQNNIGIGSELWTAFKLISSGTGTSFYDFYERYKALQSVFKVASILVFSGVQEMDYKGFTAFKDKRLSSFSSILKQVLKPEEYIFYNTPVYSMMDGEVIELNSNIEDRIHTKENRYFSPARRKILYGNYVIITKNCVNYVYGGLKQESVKKLRIGDKIKKGEQIGLVGCSNNITEYPSLLVCINLSINFFARLGLDVPDYIKDHPERAFTTMNFEPFYSYPLIDEINKDKSSLDSFYTRNLKYNYDNSRIIHSGYFIRK